MTDAPSQCEGSRISFLGLLTILFIGLKLAGVIGWAWWWVFSPLWIPIAVLLGLGLIAGILALIAVAFRPLIAAIRSLRSDG